MVNSPCVWDSGVSIEFREVEGVCGGGGYLGLWNKKERRVKP
jgi:hypothetical protein